VSALRPVSAVIPGLDDFGLLEANLPPLLDELVPRGGEVVLVDDTGRDVVRGWVERELGAHLNNPAHAAAVRVVARDENGGFAAALFDGVEAARHELVFAMNPDIRVTAGFLEPLVARLVDGVHSVVPRILLFGEDDRIESVVEIDFDRDVAFVRQRGLDGEAARFEDAACPVTYAIGGAMLLRRSPFVASGGFDRLYDPFYYEDVDLGFGAWAAGEEVVYEPASVVEHHHRGTIRKRVDEDFVRAVIERNRLLFQWKYLGDDEVARRHLASLYRGAVEAYQGDQRQELIWLVMALDELEKLKASRAARPAAKRSFEEVVRASRPRPS